MEKPAEAPAEQPAEPGRPDVTASAKVGAGPYLVGQTIPVELTVTNIGTAEATEVSGWNEHVSGSYYTETRESWGDLMPPFGQPSKLTIAAGASKTVTLQGSFYNYNGNSKFNLRVGAKNDFNYANGIAPVEIAVVEPKKAGKISGILWGDANGNGVQDAGEGLAGAKAYLYGGGDPKTRTDANGRFTFTDLETRTWGLSFNELPGGWVLQYSNEYLSVDGSDSTSELRYQAIRPLEDQLTASMRFLSTDHVDGGKATVEFTLTNKGGADIKGVIAGCDRAGMGPHIDIYDGLGELHWTKGATIPAGQSRVFTVPGTIPDNASDYGYAHVACDFGPSDGIIHGFPGVYDYVKVGDKRTDTRGALYIDHNDNGWADGDEQLKGVSISLVDPKTGQVVSTATSGDDAYAYFYDIPRGLYEVKANGPYRVVSDYYIGTDLPGWNIEVVPVNAPGGGQPKPEPKKIAPVVHKTNLAVTGANVTNLGLFGLVALVVGAGAVFFGRRKTV